jgi:hypothetical protein
MEETIEDLITNLCHDIEWDNYEHKDDDDKVCGHWKVGEVLWNKIEGRKGTEMEDETLELLLLIQERICPILNKLDKK